jgi:pimeloyl-ACP methyl ester carboxylesterase
MLAGCGEPRDESVMDEPTVEEGWVEVEPAVRLYYKAIIDGPQTVVVPAGFFLEEPLAGLAGKRTVIFYDMRDRGRSDSVPDAERLGIANDVSDLDAVRAHFGIERLNLIGWSYLGMMVAMYAFEHPERVERIVQIGPVPPRADAPYRAEAMRSYQEAVDSVGLQRLEELVAAGVREREPVRFYREYWQVFKPTLFGDTSKIESYDLPPAELANEWLHKLDRHFQAKMASIGDYDWRAEAARLQAPVLTIHGTRDRNAPYEGGREWARSFPQARLLTVDGAAHLPMVEQAELVLSAIDRFLNGEWPQQARSVQ